MPERGFTLLEIMLVIFLIGLASAGVVQTFATASEPPAKKAAQDFLTRFAQFKDIPKKLLSYYKHNLFHISDDILNIESCPEYIQKYLLSYSFASLENMSFKQRVSWLCEYLKEDAKIKKDKLESLY